MDFKRKWFRNNISEIIECGNLDLLIWFKNNGLELYSDICAEAAYYGRLDILEWAKSNDCPWDKQTVFNAIYGDNLELFKWVVDNGCEIDEICRLYAEIKGEFGDYLKRLS